MGGDTVTATGITGTAPAAISDVTGLAVALTQSIRPADHNMAGWTYPIGDEPQGSFLLVTSGLSYIFRFRIFTATVTNLLIHFTAGGTGLTAGQCGGTLHNDAGAILGAGAVTADQSTNWASGGFKTMALTTPQAWIPGNWAKMRIWSNGTTGPTATRSTSSASALINAGLAPASSRWATADSGLTTPALAVSSFANIGAMTGTGVAIWAGAS